MGKLVSQTKLKGSISSLICSLLNVCVCSARDAYQTGAVF